MKKSKWIIVLFFALIVFLTGCFNKNTNVKPSSDSQNSEIQSQNQSIAQKSKTSQPLFPATDERPIAVMIDNEKTAIPRHSGLDKAYAIYEMIVEGSDTRLMALFKGVNPKAIGPVRSSRHYFIHYALEHDAIYVHYGWSPLAQKTISQMHVNNINGLSGKDGSIFWRNPNRRSDWHNAFTSMSNIKKRIANKKYRDTSSSAPVFQYSTNEVDLKDGKGALKVNIKYSGLKKINYQYDSTAKLYMRFIGTRRHKDAVTGVQYSAKNIIVQWVSSYDLNDGPDSNGVDKGRQQMNTVGSGKGYYITDGKYVDITWEKSSIAAKTIYRYKDGTEVQFNKGQIWVQIVPKFSKVTVE